MKKDTLLVTSSRSAKKFGGAVNPPIQKTSTVLFPTIESYEKAEKGLAYYEETKDLSTSDYSYGIFGTETTAVLQQAISDIEGGGKTYITPSGLSAITLSILSFISSGDHILVADTVYGPTRRFCNKELKKYGVSVTYYDPYIGKDITKLIQKNTKIIFLESPGSLTFEVQDIPAICASAKKSSDGIVTIIDNSWATPFYFKAFEHGVDIAVQALTKYVGGHSDLILGSVTAKSDTHSKKIAATYRNLGLHTSPEDCYIAQRGIRTLGVRLKQHYSSAIKIAQWLEKRPEVEKVLYPALSSHPDNKIWKRDFTGAGGLFTFIFKKKLSREAISSFTDNLKLFGIGCSWGGFESLIISFDPSQIRTAKSWKEKGSCIRLYIGLEDPDDLITDLEAGFKRIKSKI